MGGLVGVNYIELLVEAYSISYLRTVFFGRLRYSRKEMTLDHKKGLGPNLLLCNSSFYTVLTLDPASCQPSRCAVLRPSLRNVLRAEEQRCTFLEQGRGGGQKTRRAE